MTHNEPNCPNGLKVTASKCVDYISNLKAKKQIL